MLKAFAMSLSLVSNLSLCLIVMFLGGLPPLSESVCIVLQSFCVFLVVSLILLIQSVFLCSEMSCVICSLSCLRSGSLGSCFLMLFRC